MSESAVMILDGFSTYKVGHETTMIQSSLMLIRVIIFDKYYCSFIALNRLFATAVTDVPYCSKNR
jgi:hypothetical protein